MLTGPITMLGWSFVRDDQPLEATARQLALALRDEVLDLESAGARVIQIDEPALRERLPLRQAGRAYYLNWAVEAFKLSASGVRDEIGRASGRASCRDRVEDKVSARDVRQ